MTCHLLSFLEFPRKPELQKSRWIHLLLGGGEAWSGENGVWTGSPRGLDFCSLGDLDTEELPCKVVVIG